MEHFPWASKEIWDHQYNLTQNFVTDLLYIAMQSARLAVTSAHTEHSCHHLQVMHGVRN